eukprot:TRINITY_DN62840_c0_g1_i4.p1 TRINITY_DN62840_c0_g1~~TRINITY_DN62840_c0_g1_i4.p1  ORF type:complete len:185 (-),score=22.05 TRINITY_DN62840_c0_g1_i4:68-622(-)
MPEARTFSVRLQEDLPSLLQSGPLTLFIPLEGQDLLNAEHMKHLIVKGHYPSRNLAWATLETLSTTSSPILWGKPTMEARHLSTVKVAGDYYLVHGKDDERVHIKLTTDVIVSEKLVVHFLLGVLDSSGNCVLPPDACPYIDPCLGVDFSLDANHCGSCGNVCPVGPCVNGECGFEGKLLQGTG